MSLASESRQEWLRMLQAYLDKKLSREQAEEVEAKLAQDPKAKAQLDYLRRSRASKFSSAQHGLDVRKGLRQYHTVMRMRKIALLLLPVMGLALGVAFWEDFQTPEKETNLIAEEASTNKKLDIRTSQEVNPAQEEKTPTVALGEEATKPRPTRLDVGEQAPIPPTQQEELQKPQTADSEQENKLALKDTLAQHKQQPKEEEKQAAYYYSSTDGKRGLVAGHTVMEFIPFYDKAEGKAYVIKEDSVFPVELAIGLEPLYPMEDPKETKRVLKRFRQYLAGNGYYQIMGLIADNKGALLDTSRRFTVLYHDARRLETPYLEELPYFGRVLNLPLELAQKGYAIKFFEGKAYILPEKGMTAYAFPLNSRGMRQAEKVRNPLLINKVKKEGN